jgi:hypothetical protein
VTFGFFGALGAAGTPWVMVNVRPPTVIVPVRVDPVVFFATEKEMTFDPVPDVLPRVIQEADFVAVHAHPVVEVRVRVPLPPLLPTLTLAGEIV